VIVKCRTAIKAILLFVMCVNKLGNSSTSIAFLTNLVTKEGLNPDMSGDKNIFFSQLLQAL
jgi:hypothetical protein